MNNGICEETSDEAEVTAVAKTTVEETKRRRRFLVWPKISRCFDIKCAFFAHQISEAHAQWLTFIVEKKATRKKFRQKRAPMGSRVTPEIQQRLSCALVRIALKESFSDEETYRILQRITVTIHIDNFRIYGEPTIVNKLSESFMEVCKKFASSSSKRQVMKPITFSALGSTTTREQRASHRRQLPKCLQPHNI